MLLQFDERGVRAAVGERGLDLPDALAQRGSRQVEMPLARRCVGQAKFVGRG